MTAGLSGSERSVLNKLYRGWRLDVLPDATYWYRDLTGNLVQRENAGTVDRLRAKGLIAADGYLTRAGAGMISPTMRRAADR
ncbi:MAG TPA: hypothetical protein VF076_07240 [Acidimicrobiales bacterium]